MARVMLIGTTILVCVASLVSVRAQQVDGGASVRIAEGETREGDLYASGESIEIAGRLEGDLITAGQRILTTGTITGDLFAAGRRVDIRGPVGDSTRVAAEFISVDARIDGDLVTAGSECLVSGDARITGGVLAACGSVQLDGTVDGNVRAAAGEVVIDGTVAGDVTLRADRVSLGPRARIVGDLDYRARTPLSTEEAERVSGTVRFDEVTDDDEASGSVTGSLLFWGWQTLAALLAGLLLVALFRRPVRELVSAIAGETTVGALLGFAAFLVVPAAAVFTMVTVVGLPVGLSVLVLFVVALYLAKLPVAFWAGGQLLARAGRPDPSPYLAMATGVVALYLLFAIPYVGWLLWLVATWLGLGSMVLAGRTYLSTREASRG